VVVVVVVVMGFRVGETRDDAEGGTKLFLERGGWGSRVGLHYPEVHYGLH
jgi:hypothetical protein